MFVVVLGFLLGALAVISVEAIALFLVLDRLIRRKVEPKRSESQLGQSLNAQESLNCLSNRKGPVWVLESNKIPVKEQLTNIAAKQKKKKKYFEVLPVKKHAEIRDHSLILTESDGSQATIQLMGCVIVAVSSSFHSSRKWAKRYPIKIENKISTIYNGHNSFYMYLGTSWEKESWCKALRFASCSDRDRIRWHAKMSEEFHHFLSSLTEEYPNFMKPASPYGEPTERIIRTDGSSSRVWHFLKKLTRKACKNSAGQKHSAISSISLDERKTSYKANQDIMSAAGLLKCVSERSSGHSNGVMVVEVPLTSSHLSNFGDEKLNDDDGTLCWNLLLSRLFFDAKGNTELNNCIQSRVQRMLSNMRTPSYIGGVTCTGLDLGNLPPYIHNMRILTMDMKEGKGPSDLLGDFDHDGDQMKQSGGHTINRTGIRDEEDRSVHSDVVKESKNTSWTSRVKSIVNSVASQVPLTLVVSMTSLRGTIRLQIKPPPSDRLWFGFTSMPKIDWNLESAVREHKITSSYIALLIGNWFKAAIRESLVLPNCESICIPWMLAEKITGFHTRLHHLLWSIKSPVTQLHISMEKQRQRPLV